MITQTVNNLERIVNFRPAWHKVNEEDRSKDYGVHGMEIHFVLKGPLGAIHFTMSTGMMLEKTYDWWDKRGGTQIPPRIMSMGIDVGYHSPKPMHDGHQVYWPTKMKKKDPNMKEAGPNASRDEVMKSILNVEFEKIGNAPPNCDYLGVPCYCDGSALRAEEWFNIFKEQGDKAIWEMMEQEYITLFETNEQKSN